MFNLLGILINIVISVVLSLASTLLQQAFAQKQDRRRNTGTRGSAQIGGKVPQYFLVGTVGEAGKLEYQNTWGNDGEVQNAYLTSVVSFGDLPISDMVGLFVNGVRVTITKTGAVAQGYPVAALNGKFWWKFFDGNQTTADSHLVSKFGGDADRAWASDMVGVGVPYLITTALWDETLWTNYPSAIGEFQGIKLYDPRKDSTAGGSGPQRWAGAIPTPAEQATWEFSDNNMVINYNIERGIYYDGAHVWGGKKTAAELPYDAWAAAMDACDLPIALAGTDPVKYEKQFRAGRRIALNERPGDVIKELLIGCNGRITHCADGTVYPLVGVPDEPDGVFSDADILASNPLGSIPFPNLDEIINGATATYREPSQAWEDKETAPYLRSDLEAEDDGRQQTEGLSLETTFSGTQAQRILKAVIEEGRRFRRHVVALPPEFAQFRPLQVLAWTSDRFDYEAKLFLITARTVEPFGNVILGLQEIDPADHDWNPETDEQPLSFAPVVTNRPAPQEVSGFYVEPAIWVDSLGRSRRPAIDVFWSPASVAIDVDFVRISHRLAGDTAEAWVGLIPRPKLLEGSARITEALLPDEDYEVQIQYIAGSGRQTLASGWLAVQTPDVKLGSLDVTYGDFDLDDLGDQIDGFFDWMGGSVRDLYEKAQEQDLLGADQELANAMQFDELRRSLSVVSDNLSASFEETVTVTLLPMQGRLVAIADALTELSAGDGDDVSTARFRMTAQTGETGGVTIGAQGRTGSDGSWRDAGYFLYVPNDEEVPSRFTVVADQFVITSTVGASVFQPFVFADGTMRVANAFIGGLTTVNIATRSLTADVMAAGTLTSAEINVQQLVGSAAFLTYLQVGTANIGSATIGTLQLADGAVTDAFRDFISSTVDIDISGGGTFGTVNVPASTYPATVTGYMEVSINTTSSASLQLNLVETTTGKIVDTQTLTVPPTVGGGSAVFNLAFNGYVRRPGNTTQYRISCGSAPTSVRVYYMVLSATQPKR